MAAAATLALLTAFLLLAGVLRLGFLADFISDPVLTGCKAGVGLVIVVDQAPKLLGIHIEKGHSIQTIRCIVAHIPEAGIPTLALAAITLTLLFGLEYFVPRAPAPLAAGASMANVFLDLLPELGARHRECLAAVGEVSFAEHRFGWFVIGAAVHGTLLLLTRRRLPEPARQKRRGCRRWTRS